MAKRICRTGLGERVRALRGEARLEAIGEIVSRWRDSGKSRTAFCREVEIATVTLTRWIRELDARQAQEVAAPVLVEVGARERPDRDVFEIVLPKGVCVRVPAGFSEADLARLFDVVIAAC